MDDALFECPNCKGEFFSQVNRYHHSGFIQANHTFDNYRIQCASCGEHYVYSLGYRTFIPATKAMEKKPGT